MCCSSFLKVIMFIFNGIIFLAGVAILAVGIWAKVDSSSLMNILSTGNAELPDKVFQMDYVSYVFIAVGSVLLIMGFLGCCGAITESKCMLLTFFSIVLIIFLVEVAGAIVLFVFSDLADTLLMEVEGQVRADITDNYGSNKDVTEVWNSTMNAFQCCGYRNYTDFDNSQFVAQNGGVYPDQCCRPGSRCSAGEANVDGCFDKLVKLLEDNAVIVAGVAVGIAALEVAAMVVSMILYCNIGKKSS
uniref:Tetraspanin n=1 Tax=Salarias fasciatus TaxID=181472 RepID=A0A672GD25_SALFA